MWYDFLHTLEFLINILLYLSMFGIFLGSDLIREPTLIDFGQVFSADLLMQRKFKRWNVGTELNKLCN